MWLNSLDVSEKTKATYTRNIRPFWEYISKNGITNPTRETVIAYRDALTSEGKKAATVSAYLMALKQFFHWTEDAGLYPDIAAKVKAPKQNTKHKKDPLTATQAANVLKHLDRSTEAGARDFAIVSLMATAGLRGIEVTRANIEDVQQVSDGRHSYIALMVQGKGRTDKEDHVKISAQVYDAIQNYLSLREGPLYAGTPLFASISARDKGGRLTTRSISRICKNSFLAAGINSPRITAHSLRHTAATLNLLNGGTPEETQQLMRHQNPATTQIYSHALDRGNNESEDRITKVIFSELE